ncbi:MAG: glycosyltransferase [Thermoplasmata archaeon]
MQSVELEHKALEDYKGIVSEEILDSIVEAAEPLQGKRVLHINSTSFGGGVAEILSSMVPLMVDLGLDAHWRVIEGDPAFFNTTKSFHNSLQGGDVNISDEMRGHYKEVNRKNAEDLKDDWDVVVVHDLQPAALIEYVKREGVWIWRCHLDLSTPNRDSLAFIGQFIASYDSAIYTMEGYIPSGIGRRKPAIIHPSIDPLSSKNLPMEPTDVDSILARYDIDPSKPTVSSVARFDPWKDPIGTIDLYRVVKRRVPDLQLLLVSSMADDDPEGWEYFEKAVRRAGEDPDIFFLTNMIGVGNREVNAIQRRSSLGLLKSIREGFGLTVSESLWKRVPVIGSRVGGIPLQIMDGENGFIVDDSRGAVEPMVRLLKDEVLRERMGEAGKAHVRKNFLITRHLRDYINLFVSLLEDSGRGTT